MNPLSTRRTSLALGVVAASLLATALATPSAAATAEASASARTADTRLERQVEGLLRHNEGAERVAKDRVRLAPGVEMSVVPSTRAAADGTGDCRTGYACVWQHRDATGYRLDFYNYGSYTLSNYRMPDGTSWQDQVSSYYNAQTGGAWIVGKNWVTSGGSGQLERIWGGPTYAYEALVHANDQADVVELYP
ncbi:peptidase inhibitor family I36 protein [Streptomyces europaeiscabiei]|uniref:peptidase inhibitor family I36 protein n=1 Tax=Streptomyces europaeiscabiei TaxID=146819 RepID=UPI0029AFF5A5|nr:peptidase inhibitor family I36 protein [Streptomyces europaeiscabiei]MDX3581262.1 peptidase inhibitor family I36 protein [Streptomyces europaeiscabiei]